MDLASIDILVPLVAAAAYAILLLGVWTHGSQQGSHTGWFLGFLGASAIWELILLFLMPNSVAPCLAAAGLAAGTLVLALTTNAYVDWPRQQRWLIAGSGAIVLAIGLDVAFPRPLFANVMVRTTPATPGGLLSLLVWFSLSATILIKTWRNYQQTRLPWHANRLLHWSFFVLVTFTGELILLNNTPWLHGAGQAVRLLGVLGLARAVISHRLFDVRARLRKGLAFVLIAVASAAPATAVLLATLWVTDRLSLDSSYAYALTFVIMTAGLVLYQPFRRFLERIIYRYLVGEEFQTGKVVRSYSQATSRTLDVEQLSLVIIGTISELLETTGGALMLVSRNGDDYEVEPIPALGNVSRQKKRFTADSLFIQTLSDHRQPLLQYELDFNPYYAGMEAHDRDWLNEQGMEVYVPVHTGNELSGLIALGPKHSGLAYRANELELVQVLADQTVIALQNARLYREVNRQNDRIRQLNSGLRQQNERLEILDKIKSDFITIASHELRTPLTQVKGYADILEAMNEGEGLSQEHAREIVGHINRASSRLEALITAMLDASELESSGIQLVYVESRLDAIMHLATEPLAPALHRRRLRLEMNGVEDVPTINADFKRLVQTFHNIIGNAVKYTPDGGTITVTAELAPSVDGESQFVEIEVADTGIGIDPQFHEMIFEKFFRIGNPRLHSTGATKFMGAGPGLGLHIAKGVIEAHGGRIWVESEGEDKERLPGSHFHIILPVDPPVAPAATTAETPFKAEEASSLVKLEVASDGSRS